MASDAPAKNDSTAANVGVKEVPDAPSVGMETTNGAVPSSDAKQPSEKQSMLPPPAKKKLVPPVPRFQADQTAPPGGDFAPEDKKVRAAALANASKAAMHVTPAQREKAIAEAAAAAAAGAYSSSKSQNRGPQAPSTQEEAPPQEPSKAMAKYQEPDWAGIPEGVTFSLETMKGGQILETRQLTGKSRYTFGRAAGSDYVLEHPSISRLHAVLQFRADGPPTLYDCGSTHGSFLNKKRLQPGVHVNLSVGDILKFGQSSRMFILGGPADLMPDEGPSRAQRKHRAAIEAKERRQFEEQEVAKAQMAAALNRGISWGMGDDAAPSDDDDSAPTVDWRAYAQSNPLSDRQQKLADKVRRLENRIRNLTTEAEKIRAKQTSMEDLTPGQAATLARNEQLVDKSTEDLEDLEEMLNDSISDSLRGKKQQAKEAKPSKKRRKRPEEEEDEVGSSDEDDFYDRTAPGKAKKRATAAAAIVHDAASLFGRKEALLEEMKRLQKKLEEAVAEAGQLEAPPPENPTENPAADPLDAFMSGVADQLEQGKVEGFRQEIAKVQAEVDKLEKLLKTADPDGYYREGTHAAKVAREKGLRLFYQDKERQAALERKKRQQEAQRRAEDAAAKQFVPETEEPEAAGNDSPPAIANPAEQVHRLEPSGNEQGGLSVPAPSAEPPTAEPAGDEAPAAPGLYVPEKRDVGAKQKRDAMIKAALAKESASKTAAGGGGAPAGEDAILADLAVLQRATQAGEDAEWAAGEKVDIQETGWRPPQGQSGDGRTSLNDKLGY